MSITDELKALERYAREAREAADAILADLPVGHDLAMRPLIEALKAKIAAEPKPDPDWKAVLSVSDSREFLTGVLKIVRDRAARTVERAASPVKVGVVGRFNAGKSLLVGALLGFADGIPVKPVPTTGNVTALYFKPSNENEPELHTTRFETFTVEFLDREAAQACLKELLVEAQRLTAQIRLPAALNERLSNFDPENKRSLQGLDDWCREAWESGTEEHPTMRMLIRELVWFARAYLNCGEALCNPPQRFRISHEAAREGLTLDAPGEVRSMRFAELPPSPRPLSSPPPAEEDETSAAVTPDFLRTVFPLIARLRVDVVVARVVWDLRPLKGTNEFVLLDFPGLDAAFSGVRDRFLCRRELKNVQSILLLLNSTDPGGGGWKEIFASLAEKPADLSNFTMVGISLFDQLEMTQAESDWLDAMAPPESPATSVRRPPSKPNRTARQVFDDDDSPPPAPSAPASSLAGEKLTEAKLLERIATLKASVALAESMVPPDKKDRIVLLSSMVYLKQLADGDSRLAVASPDFLPEIYRKGEQAEAARALWERVAKRIRAADTALAANSADRRAGLLSWLEQFASDGGVSALRMVLERHVREHGLGQLRVDMEDDTRALDLALGRLTAVLPPPAGAAGQATDPSRLEQIRTALGVLKEYYQAIANRVKQGVKLQAERNGRPVPVTELIDEEAVYRIYSWPHWNLLFRSVKSGYVVEGAKTGGGVFRDEDGNDEADVTVGFPTNSDHFFGVFERTLADLQAYTREQIEVGVDYWLRSLPEQARDSRERLKVEDARRVLMEALAVPELPAEIKKLRLDQDIFRGLVSVLRAAVNPPLMKQIIFPDGEDRPEMNRSLSAGTLFPQARTGGEGEHGRTFGWARILQQHKDPGARPDKNLAHLAQVVRLRDDFITIVCQEMAQTVSLVLKQLDQRIDEALTELWQKLASAEEHRGVVDTLARGGTSSQSAAGGEDYLVPVRRLSTLRR